MWLTLVKLFLTLTSFITKITTFLQLQAAKQAGIDAQYKANTISVEARAKVGTNTQVAVHDMSDDQLNRELGR